MEENNLDIVEAKTLKAKKFIVYLFMVSSAIMFGGFTSYYIVFAASKGKGHGLILPEIFLYSTIVLVASSLTLFMSSRAFKSGNISLQRTLLWITMILGIAFGVMQFEGWKSLIMNGAVLINNNASISMIYVVTAFHLLHILAGLFFIIGVLLGSYQSISVDRQKFRMQSSSIFWHFIDILWIYLYVFLLLNS